MTNQATSLLMKWAKDKTKQQQKVLAIALEDSMLHGEAINKTIAEEVLKAVNEVIKIKKIK